MTLTFLTTPDTTPTLLATMTAAAAASATKNFSDCCYATSNMHAVMLVLHGESLANELLLRQRKTGCSLAVCLPSNSANHPALRKPRVIAASAAAVRIAERSWPASTHQARVEARSQNQVSDSVWQ